MRALLSIPRLPPPRLQRPEDWSLAFRDVTTECLTKRFMVRGICAVG